MIFRLLLGVLFCAMSLLSWAQTKGDPNKFGSTPGNSTCRFFDGFADNGNGTVTDPRNGLIWKRCTEGMSWNGSSCHGKGNDLTWFDAMKIAKNSRFLGKDNWRLPSKEEFEKVVGSYRPNCEDNSSSKDQFAVSQEISRSKARQVWAFSPSSKDVIYAWTAAFGGGGVHELVRDNFFASQALLVRDNHASEVDAALEFSHEYAKMDEYRKGNERDKRENLELKRQEDQRRAYENSSAGRAEARRAQQARQMCEAQKQTCVAQCPAYTSSNSRAANTASVECTNQCDRISCN